MTKDELGKILAEHAAWTAGHTHGKQANLNGANLGEASLSQANLIGANLSQANLSEANLNRANLNGANLSQANLIGANLSQANLGEASLSQANLNGAILSQANLSQANLNRANLSGAYLRGANLSGAYLGLANLSGVYDVITLGQPDGWWAFAYAWEDTIWVRVGCRTKSIADGRAYWAGEEDRREVLAALDYAETVARLRGWEVEI